MLDWLLWMAMSRLVRDRARVMVRDRARLMVGVGVGVGVRVLVYGDVSPHRVGAQLEHAQVLEALAVLDLTRRDRLRLHLVRVGVRVGIRVRVRVRVRIRVKG